MKNAMLWSEKTQFTLNDNDVETLKQALLDAVLYVADPSKVKGNELGELLESINADLEKYNDLLEKLAKL